MTGDKTYTATFTSTVNSYTISWDTNGDGTVDDTTTVAYGSTPTHADGSKSADAQYTYTFDAWSPAITSVTGDKTYTATFTSTVNSYTISWDTNGDGTVDDTTTVAYGTVPTHADGSKTATPEYTYTFSVWDPTPVAVTGAATYTATFSSTVNEYTISWDTNGDGTVDDTTTVAYGSTPTHADGSKPADAQNTYSFSGWDPAIASVTGEQTYTAQFTAAQIPVLALAKPTISSTVLASGTAGATVKVTVDPAAVVTTENANVAFSVEGNVTNATFTSLPWNEAVDWTLSSSGAEALPGRFYAKGETSWFSKATNELETVTGLVDGMKGVDMVSAPSASNQMVRIQTCLEIPEGAMETLPAAAEIGAARTGFAVAQTNANEAPAFFAFTGASWEKLCGAAPVANTTNDLLIVLDVQASTARYYVDGVALYKDNAGTRTYALAMRTSETNAIHGIGFANPDGVRSPVVAEYDVPFEAAVGDVPYAAAADGLTNADKTGAQTLYLLTNGVAGTISLAANESVKVDTAKGSFAEAVPVVLASGVPAGYAIQATGEGSLTNYSVVAVRYPIEYVLGLDDATNAVANTLTNSYTVADLPIVLHPAGCEGYTFAGWTNNFSANVVVDRLEGIAGAVTNWATWHQNAFTITWNVDGATTTSEVLPGVVPSYSGTPTKAADDTYTYAFAGWTPALAAAESNTVYTAVFTPNYIDYTITWNYVDPATGNMTSDQNSVHWDAVPSHADPADYVANNTMYAFDTWSPAPAAYDGTVIAYTASYTPTAAKATVISVADGKTEYFPTVEEALAAAGSGDTVKLLADCNTGIGIGAGTNIVLDLGGYTLTNPNDCPIWPMSGTLVVSNGTIRTALTGADYSAIYVNGGDLTLGDDLVVDATVVSANGGQGGFGVTVAKGGTVTVDGATINAREMCVFVASQGGNATVNVVDGTLTSTDNAVIGGYGTSGYGGNTINVSGGTLNASIVSDGYAACGIYAPNDDTVNISGGTINVTGGAGVVARAGSVTITGGTINTTGNTTGKVGDSRVVVPCAAVVFDSEAAYPGYDSDESGVVIEGGTFVSEVTTVQLVGGDEAIEIPATVTIGGVEVPNPARFSDADAEGVPEGYALKEVPNSDPPMYAISQTFVVTYANYDGTALQVTTNFVNDATPDYAGDTPTRVDETGAFVYTFAEAWSPAVAETVTETVTYTATYTATSLAAATWIGGESDDWNVPANWDIGYVPTKATVVTFTNDAAVGISPTVCKCKEIVLDNADVTIGRADSGTGADLNFYKTEGSAVSGTGTLALDTVGMFNQNNAGVLTIGTALDIRGDVTFKGVKDGNQHAGSWTITGKTTIADGVTVKSIDDAITTFQGDIDIGAGSQVTFFAAYGANEQYHGGEIVASKVTLAHNEGSPATKLVLETRNKGKITISDSQVITDDAAYEVKKSSADGKTTYEAVLKTFSVIWLAEDGATQLDATNGVPHGTSYASLAAPTPTKDATAACTYTFAGWVPTPDATVTSNATYTASFTETTNKYDVIWVADGAMVASNRVDYGTATSSIQPVDPTKTGDAGSVYTFTGWSPAVAATVTADVTYTAGFSSIYIDPASLELYPNCSNYVHVVGAPEGSTYTYKFAGQVVCDSYVLNPPGWSKTEGWAWPYGRQPGGTGTITVTVTNDNAQIAVLTANVTVKDVAAVVDGVEYSKDQFADAMAAAVSGDSVLGVYYYGYSYGKVALEEDESIRWKPADNRGKGSLWTSAVTVPATTDAAWYKAVASKDNETGITTITCEDQGVPYVKIDDGTTVTYATDYFPGMEKTGSTYTMLRDVERSGSIVASAANVVLDLNGHELTLTKGSMNVRGGLTVVDNSQAGTGSIVKTTATGTDTKLFLVNGGGTVAITGGAYESAGEILYTDETAGSAATISGGTFSSTAADTAFLLNCSDGNKGAIAVTGGSFQGFNPQNNTADGEGTDYVAEGYYAFADDPSAGWYTVKPAFTVLWVADGTTLETDENVASNSVPSYDGATPTKARDAQFTYTFANAWTPAVGPVVSNTTFTAVFTETLNRYKIKFVDYNDAEIIPEAEYDYGTLAADIITPPAPTRPGTTFRFTGWSPSLATVTTNQVYKATYAEEDAIATVITVAQDGTETLIGSYTNLEEAVAAAQSGQTVKLLDDVTLNGRILVSESITIDLGGKTITRTAAPAGDNGSAFRVDGDYDVTIKNGAIDCSGVDDTLVADDGVYAIDVKNGGDLTLADLAITVNSECGACVYPWKNSHVTIESGTYVNTTTTPYRHHAGWQGMAVNQANVSDKLITINGGTFSQQDPQVGDDSTTGTDAASADFTGDGYVAIGDGNGNWVVQPGWNVTFDANGGAPTPDAQRVADGGTATTPVANPAKAGSVFAGWTLDNAAYDFDTVLSADITLVAAYDDAKVTVFTVADNGATTNTIGYYATLAEAVGEAVEGATVLLLDDVTLDGRILVSESITIDLGGKTITRTAAPAGDNGSAFRVDGDYDVTIKNGAIDCSGVDDTLVADDGVYAIDVKNGGDLTLADLAITVNSECGACVYPWKNSHVTIESGTYVNTTTTPYRHHAGWQGMAVNQANVSDKLITINGGTFSQQDPQVGDDSTTGTDAASADFTGDGYVAIGDGNGNWVVQPGWNVTFDANGGAPTPDAQRVADGGTATEPEDPEKATFDFRAWQLNGVDYDFDTVLSADIELVADWSLKQYDVIWVADGGQVASNRLEHGKAIVAPADPTKAGDGNALYTFVGWTPAPDATVSSNATYTAAFKTWTKVAVPTAETGLVYDGSEKTGVLTGADYTLSGNTATNAGSYTATVKLADPASTVWAGDTVAPTTATNKTVSWLIGKATVKVTAEDKTQVYGEAAEVLTYTTDPATLVEGNSFDGALAREEGDGVGTYAIGIGTLSAGDNYEIDFTGATYTITAAPMTITVAGYNGVYDGAAHVASATTEPVGATITWSVDGGAFTDAVPSVTGVTNVTIVAKATLANYTDATASTSLVVTAKAITIAADNKTKVYDNDPETDPALTATVTDAIEGDTINYTLARAEGQDVDDYAITVTAGENPNYTVSVQSGTFSITAATATIPTAAANLVYDGTEQTGVAEGTGYTIVGNKATNAGDYTATLTLAANYKWSDDTTDATKTIAWSIAKKAATITVANASKKHGEADPAFTGTVSVLVAEGDLGTVTYGRTNDTEAVGVYAGVIVPTYTANANYDVTVTPGTFTIVSNAFTVIWLADDGTTEYGRTQVEWGDTPTFTGDTPKSDPNGKYAYEFKAWTPTPGPVTEATNFVATFNTTIDTPLALAVADEKLASTVVTPLDKRATVAADLIGAVEGVEVAAQGATVAVSDDTATATFSNPEWNWNQGVEWTMTAQQTAADDEHTVESASLPGKFYVKPETAWFTATTNQLEAVSDASEAAVAYTNAVASNEGEMVRVHTKIAVPAVGLSAEPAHGSAKVGFAVLQLDGDTEAAYYAFGNNTWTKLSGAKPVEGDRDYLAVYDLAAATPTARYYIDGVALYAAEGGAYAIPIGNVTSLSGISFASKEMVKDDIVAEQDVSYVAAVGDTPYTDAADAVAAQAKDPNKTMELLKKNVAIAPVPLANTDQAFVVDYTLGSFTNENPAVSTAPGYSVKATPDAENAKLVTYALDPDVYDIDYVLNLASATNAVANPTNYTVETLPVEFLAAGAAGYTFEGWTNAAGAQVTGLDANTIGAVTNYASWQLVTYNIAYTLNGGAVDPADANPATYTVESPAIELVNPTKQGYDFAGWTGTDLGDATNLAVTIPTGSTGDRAYTATWTPALVDYTVKHLQQSVDGLSYVEVEDNRETLQGYTESQTDAVAKNYEGFQAGVFQQTEIAADGSTVVEIKYDRASFVLSIAYVTPAGVTAPNAYEGSFVYGASYSVESPSVTGYTPDVDVVAGTMPAAAVTTNVTYTANKYAITFVDEDGTTLKAATEYDYGTLAADIEKPDDPTKAATADWVFEFAGWSPALATVTNDATYTATYTSNATVAAVITVADATTGATTTNYVDSLVDAIAAANDGDTVQLLADVEEPAVALEDNITLDLNGNTWTVVAGEGESEPGTIVVSGDVAIVDNSGSDNGAISSAADQVLVVDAADEEGATASVTIGEDAAIVATGVDATALAVVDGEATVEGDVTGGVAVAADGALTVDGGTVMGDIASTGGDVTVAGGTVDGTITASGDTAAVVVSAGSVKYGVTASGGADVTVSDNGSVAGGVTATGAGSEATITGGEIAGGVTIADGARGSVSGDDTVVNGTLDGTTGTLSITDGFFGSDPTDYLAEGYVAILDGQTGLYDVRQGKSVIGTTITVAGGTYNGQPYAIGSVVLGNYTLTADDYTVVYTNVIDGVATNDNVNAGSVTAWITGKGEWIDTTNVTFTIDPAVVTVTAPSKDVRRGTDPATLTFEDPTYSGFVNSETADVLTSAATAAASTNATGEAYTATTAKGATFPIVASGAAAANYTFKYVDGTLTVVAGAIAAVDGTEYDKIADAVAVAGTTEDGKVVVMLDDADADVALAPQDVLKIELAGFGVTVKADDAYAARWNVVSNTVEGVTTYTLDEIKAMGLMITEFDYAGAYLVYNTGKAEDLAWDSDKAYCTVVTATDLKATRWNVVSGTCTLHSDLGANQDVKVENLDTTGNVRFFRIAVTPYVLSVDDTVEFAPPAEGNEP